MQKNALEQQFPRITWQFNASRAPWLGGFFERFMFIIKDWLARCFMSHRDIYANYAQFGEAVAYVMSIINSRPLTWTSEDPDETRHPICPQVFLNFHSKYNFLVENPLYFGPHDVSYTAASTDALRGAFQARRRAYDAFFNIFRDTYIAELRKFRKQTKQPTDHRLEVGSLLFFRIRGLFEQDGAGDRRKWRLARVVKLHPSPLDGRVRSVDLEIHDHTLDRLKIIPSQSITNWAMLDADESDLPTWIKKASANYE
jgi:hypothetical protein